MQIETIKNDMWKNNRHHDELEHIINMFEDPAERDIQVPFQFFFDLYKEQHREVEKLALKVKEAENLAEKLH